MVRCQVCGRLILRQGTRRPVPASLADPDKCHSLRKPSDCRNQHCCWDTSQPFLTEAIVPQRPQVPSGQDSQAGSARPGAQRRPVSPRQQVEGQAARPHTCQPGPTQASLGEGGGRGPGTRVCTGRHNAAGKPSLECSGHGCRSLTAAPPRSPLYLLGQFPCWSPIFPK